MLYKSNALSRRTDGADDLTRWLLRWWCSLCTTSAAGIPAGTIIGLRSRNARLSTLRSQIVDHRLETQRLRRIQRRAPIGVDEIQIGSQLDCQLHAFESQRLTIQALHFDPGTHTQHSHRGHHCEQQRDCGDGDSSVHLPNQPVRQPIPDGYR